MTTSYTGTLHGDRIEWDGEAPELADPTRIRVQPLGGHEKSIVTEEEARERTRRALSSLEKLSKLDHPFQEVDAIEWQRKQRKDRPLPGRASE